MKVIQATKEAFIITPSGKDSRYGKSWCFDVDIIPDKPTPKKIIIQWKSRTYIHSWEMSWRKFLKQTCIGHVALIDKSEFTYTMDAK